MIHFVEGISENSKLRSRNIIIFYFLPLSLLNKIPVHWFLARKSYIFNEDEVKVALSTMKNNFSLFLLHHNHFHHYFKLMIFHALQKKKTEKKKDNE